MQAGEGNAGQGLQAVAMRSSPVLGGGFVGATFHSRSFRHCVQCSSLWLSLETATWVFNIF